MDLQKVWNSFIKYSPLLVIFAFLVLKFSYFSYKYSDTYGYFMHGTYILQGKMLYRDMFMTNLPLFPYISAMYVWLIGDHVWLFTRISSIEAALCAFLIWLIIRKTVKSIYVQTVILVTYLFSALILINTEFQSGIITAALFALLTYYLYTSKRFVLAGIALGLTLCAKGYLIGVPAALILYDIYKRRWQSWTLILPYLITVFAILAPSLIYVREDFFRNIFFTVNRPENPNRIGLYYYLLLENWLFFITLIAAFINMRKNPVLAVFAGGSTGFLLYFQDAYYPYFNIALPFLVLPIADIYLSIKNKISSEGSAAVVTALCIASVLLHINTYIENYPTNRFDNPEKMIQVIQQANPDVLYGSQDIVPLLSAITKVPLMNGIIDTNPKIYQRGLYKTEEVTNDVFRQKTIVILYAHIDPQGNIYTESFITESARILEQCSILYKQPIQGTGAINHYVVFKCF